MRATREQQYITWRYYTGNTRLSDLPSLSEFVNSAILLLLHGISCFTSSEENLLQRGTFLQNHFLTIETFYAVSRLT